MSKLEYISDKELITEITRLEQEIQLKTMKYNILVKILNNRYPQVEEYKEYEINDKKR